MIPTKLGMSSGIRTTSFMPDGRMIVTVARIVAAGIEHRASIQPSHHRNLRSL